MERRSSYHNRKTTTTSARPSIFSLHDPSSAIKILKRNKLNSGNHLTGVIFWYHFRSYFPLIAVLLAILFYLIPLFTKNTLRSYLIYGGFVSLIMCTMTIISYYHIIPWRKHPSPLIFYRTLSHFFFSIIIILNSFNLQSSHELVNDSTCHFFSFITQFTFITGESWLLTIAIDLYLSLTNPFTSYKSNLLKYHWVVWITGFFNAFSLVSSNGCRGVFADHVCWIHVDSVLSPCLWGYYLSWIVFYYLTCVAVISFALLRISRGLESSYESRKACVKSTFLVVITYILYSVLCFLVYVIVLFQEDYNASLARNLKNFVAYLLALRGFVDAALWFTIRDFRGIKSKSLNELRDGSVTPQKSFKDRFNSFFSMQIMSMSTPLVGGDSRASLGVTSDSDGASREQSRINFPDEGNNQPRLSVEEDFGIDIDLSPQLNMALREEVLHFTTLGIIKSVEAVATPYPFQTRSFTLDHNHTFVDYQPRVFKNLREINGISEEWYMSQISHTAKERLAEGGSGAFMFFCGSGEFVVKTILKSESETLLEILSQYVNHLVNTPESLLVRFLGLHSLNMYNQIFHFVVMKNIFPPSAIINTRYDIKGSWIHRNGGVVPPGKRIFCRHCGELFISGSSTSCPDIVGVHEANFTLKDNDLTTKIRLRPEDAYTMIETLNKDSDALCAMGITDYSMLVGIRNLQYNVDPEKVISKSRMSNVAFSRESLDSFSAPWNTSPQSPLPQLDSLTGSAAVQLPYPHGVYETSSVSRHIIDQESHENEQSLTSEMTTSRVQGNGGPSGEFETNPPSHDIRIRASSEVTVNNNIINQNKLTTTFPDRDRDRESNMLEISEEEMAGGYLARSVIAPGVYYIGIIDILQRWTWEKRLEWFFKVYILQQSENGISCMSPIPYRTRFQYKMSQIFEHSIFIREITGSWIGKREVTTPAPLIDT